VIYAKIFFKGLGKLLLVLLALAVSLYLLVWAINLKDEAPSAESLQLQQILQSQVPVPEEENGFVYYTKHFAKSLELSDDLRAVLRCESAQCLSQLQDSPTDLIALLKPQDAALDAYQTLMNFPGWQSPEMLISSPFVNYIPLIEMQQLFLLDIWLTVQTGDTTHVKTKLQQDLSFWRKQLLHANNPFYKRLAVYRIERHFMYATFIKQHMPTAEYQQLMPELWSQPFNEGELSLLLAMAGEWRTNVDAINNMLQSGSENRDLLERVVLFDLWRPFVKHQAVSNTFARLNIACAEQQSAIDIVDYPWYSWLYNPLGKIFTTIGTDICLEHNKPLLGLESKRMLLLNGKI
jgi:hypothetical protein